MNNVLHNINYIILRIHSGLKLRKQAEIERRRKSRRGWHKNPESEINTAWKPENKKFVCIIKMLIFATTPLLCLN